MPEHQSRKLTASEIDGLGDRLLSRAISRLSPVESALKADMLLATGCCRVLARIARASPNGSLTVDTYEGR